jgi:hypothetical protein
VKLPLVLLVGDAIVDKDSPLSSSLSFHTGINKEKRHILLILASIRKIELPGLGAETEMLTPATPIYCQKCATAAP